MKFFMSLLAWTLTAFAGTQAADSVTLNGVERAGVNRVNECAVFGVPLPRSAGVTNASQLCLKNAAGAAVPAQFDVLARWGGAPGATSAPAKWVLVSSPISVSSHGTNTLTMDLTGPGPSPAIPLTMDTSTPHRITVETGGARFDVNIESFNLLDQVTVSGQALLSPLTATNAIRYRESLGRGLVAGTTSMPVRVTSAELERHGALYAMVKVRGSVLNAHAEAILDYTARLHFYAGRPDVRLDFTVENNHAVIPRADDGQPENVHNQGATNSVYVGGLSLALRLRETGAALRVLTEQGADVTSPISDVRLYQEASGISHWDAYVGLVGWPGYEASAAPRLQSYCARPGFEITYAGASVTGMQALGWMTAWRDDTAGPRLTAVVREFRQNFPKAIVASSDGTLSVDLFPEGDRFGHNLRVGEEKTHSLLFRFGVGAGNAEESESVAQAFAQPLFGVAPASWVTGSGVLGEVPEIALAGFPRYERYVRVAFEPNPDYDPATDDPSFGNTTLRDALERYNFFGWQDYGDVPLDYEAFGENQAGQMNLKYWFGYGMLMQFCRSAEWRWMELGLPAVRHLADIDYLHIPDTGIAHWSQGAYFGHSAHDEPGNMNPNRNYNSPSVDLFFGVPDLALAYDLTGECRFREVALEGLEAMLTLSQFSDFTHPIFQRERANLIFAYIEGYRLTGDARWLDQLRTIVGYTADLSNKGWVTDPAGYGAAHPGESMRMFQFSQVVWALGRYLDFCVEYGFSDDLGVAAALQAYGDFVINYAMTEYSAGRAVAPYEYFFDRSDPITLDINNWTLVLADVLAYAWKYTGLQRFLDAAEKFYATGTIDPAWQDDPPVYTDTKQLVNSINWGLVYMNQAGASEPTNLTTAVGVAGDFDGDGLGDPVIYNDTTGAWSARLSASGYAAATAGLGGSGYAAVSGDFDGDGKADPAVVAAAMGQWQVLLSGSGYQVATASLGGTGYAAVSGDFDGDQRSDPAVYHETSGAWSVMLSGSGYAMATASLGGTGYTAVSGDFDGDGLADPAVYAETNGQWQVMLSASGYQVATVSLGGTGYAAVSGDFDGDRRNDPTIYRQSTGTWQAMLSGSDYAIASAAFGGAGRDAVSGDFDGDGLSGPAVFHAVSGVWTVMLSASGYAQASIQF